MKAIVTGLAALIAAGAAWGQVANLSGADVTDKSSIPDPAQASQQIDNQWLAFTIPVLNDTTSPCCWKGDWKQLGQAGCHLAKQHTSYGSRSDAPLAESLVVYAKIKEGTVQSMRVVGDQCPVEGDGEKVDWLGEVDETAGLSWLEAIARSDGPESTRHSALYAMALHRSDRSEQRLAGMARGGDPDLQKESIFWLGEARGESGLKQLKQLLDELAPGDTRRELNFAIAMSGTPAAQELLIQVSRNDPDPEQRSGALFWLAQEFPQAAQRILLETMNNESDPDVLEQAVFAISQLPDDMAGPMLLDLATNSQAPREARRQALFWLAQSDDDQTIAALADMLTQ